MGSRKATIVGRPYVEGAQVRDGEIYIEREVDTEREMENEKERELDGEGEREREREKKI